MTSSNGNIFRVTGHLCGGFIWNIWYIDRWQPLIKLFGFFVGTYRPAIDQRFMWAHLWATKGKAAFYTVYTETERWSAWLPWPPPTGDPQSPWRLPVSVISIRLQCNSVNAGVCVYLHVHNLHDAVPAADINRDNDIMTSYNKYFFALKTVCSTFCSGEHH